jgi:hypothetical protein
MKIAERGIRQSLRFSGVLLMLGLLVELISLLWTKPLAFLLFAVVGGSFLVVGALAYLYSLVSAANDSGAQN